MYALSEFKNGREQLDFCIVESRLNEIISTYGGGPSSDYPFWRLQNDGVWVVEGENWLRSPSGDVRASQLRDRHAMGRFSDQILGWLRVDRQNVVVAANEVITTFFPDGLRDDIRQEFPNLDSVDDERDRDQDFPRIVKAAYNFKCAVCGFDGRLDAQLFALHAAHIKPFTYGGPCSIDNGMALCALHHNAFDRGVISINADLTLAVSNLLSGDSLVSQLFHTKRGTRIQIPARAEQLPGEAFLGWHRSHVFRQ